jgi:DEAD/DEAH box helicase domain-containing protein
MADRGCTRTMNLGHPINDYITALKAAKAFDGQVVYHREFEPSEPTFGEPREPWPEPIRPSAWSHGNRSAVCPPGPNHRPGAGRHPYGCRHPDRLRQDPDLYTLPVFEIRDKGCIGLRTVHLPVEGPGPGSIKAINSMSAHLPDLHLRAQIYDGDTSAYRRKKIRDNPPHVLMTNPEMIHLSMLPHHDRWADLLGRLRFVVVDEVHTYRGILGSHMAQVFRRLQRMCNVIMAPRPPSYSPRPPWPIRTSWPAS